MPWLSFTALDDSIFWCLFAGNGDPPTRPMLGQSRAETDQCFLAFSAARQAIRNRVDDSQSKAGTSGPAETLRG
jgi:hypothetical protein